jgi:hypothetical protein
MTLERVKGQEGMPLNMGTLETPPFSGPFEK